MAKSLEAFVKSGLEGFVSGDDSKEKRDSYVNLATVIITFVIVLIILSLVGHANSWTLCICFFTILAENTR